ncbi:MAG: ATPase [Clostridia bacterium]|nr:ATPase [Clostridia bacterium]
MKKVSLIIRNSQKEEVLKKLRKLGIVHIEITEGSGERLNALQERVALLERTVFTIGKAKGKEQISVSVKEALSIADKISALDEEKKRYQAEKIQLNAELDRLKGWGDIDPRSLKTLKSKGYEISLYEMPKAEYGLLDESIKTVRVGTTKTAVRFMTVQSGKEYDESVLAPLEQYRFALPKLSGDEITKRIAELTARTDAVDETVAAYGSYIDSLKHAIKLTEKEIEFETYATGMTDEDLSTESRKNVGIAHFSGYIEAENLEKLKKAAEENAWGLVAEDPTEEDNIPTKLKNNKFVSLIYPLTDFLGTVPGYFEYDISGWFLAFILIFFGIIFGDGGYGLLICAVAGIPIIKSLTAKKKVSPAFLLIGLFGLSTVVWGTLTCTWFGLTPQQLPAWLKSLSVPVISNVYGDKIWYPFWTNGKAGLTTAQNLQILCFVLALIQLTVAHVKCAIRNRKSLKIIGDIGSAIELVGMFYLVLSFVVSSEVFSFGLVIGGIPVGTCAIVFVAVGFIASFIFANYEGSVVKSVLSSLTNIVSVLLGIFNLFSDIVSYIRLWAVGLAGAAISATVNGLAGPLLGHFMFAILAIVLLVFGHGLNMILNILSVIVHGIRLNTLEFSSHLGMSWSGYKFKPFEEKINT